MITLKKSFCKINKQNNIPKSKLSKKLSNWFDKTSILTQIIVLTTILLVFVVILALLLSTETFENIRDYLFSLTIVKIIIAPVLILFLIWLGLKVAKYVVGFITFLYFLYLMYSLFVYGLKASISTLIIFFSLYICFNLVEKYGDKINNWIDEWIDKKLEK